MKYRTDKNGREKPFLIGKSTLLLEIKSEAFKIRVFCVQNVFYHQTVLTNKAKVLSVLSSEQNKTKQQKTKKRYRERKKKKKSKRKHFYIQTFANNQYYSVHCFCMPGFFSVGARIAKTLTRQTNTSASRNCYHVRVTHVFLTNAENKKKKNGERWLHVKCAYAVMFCAANSRRDFLDFFFYILFCFSLLREHRHRLVQKKKVKKICYLCVFTLLCSFVVNELLFCVRCRRSCWLWCWSFACTQFFFSFFFRCCSM